MRHLKITAFVAFCISISSLFSQVFIPQAHAVDGVWFLHKFGELRAYHGSFLNVCQNNGDGPCRTVQYGFESGSDDSFFGNQRMSIARVHEMGDPQYTVEMLLPNMPDTPVGPITFSIDGEIFSLGHDRWISGSPEGYNVSATFSVIDQELTTQLITALRKGNRLRVLYAEFHEAWFDLNGLSRALDAIEDQLLK